jgi:NYN domain
MTHMIPIDQTVVDRHRMLNRALEATGVEITLGTFKQTVIDCKRDCKLPFNKYEEKKSDVNLAMGVIESFYKDDVDCAVIVSGDTDQIATIDAVRKLFPAKTIGVLLPAFRQNYDLRLAAHFQMEIKAEHYEKHQLPPAIKLQSGKTITKPPSW